MIFSIATLVARLFQIFEVLIVIWCILSWVPRGSGFVEDLRATLGSIVEPYLGLFRRVIPPMGGIDFSPIVAILALDIIERFVLRILV